MLNGCAGNVSVYLDTNLDAAETELAMLDAQINAATHRRLELIRLIDASSHWVAQGAKSCAHWLS